MTGHARRLRALAELIIVIGGIGSLFIMLRAGSRNPSLLLILLFAGWVLAPFIGLLTVHKGADHWHSLASAILYGVTLLIVVGSLFIYWNVLAHPPRKAAFPFLVVPLGSLALLAMVIGLATVLSRKRL